MKRFIKDVILFLLGLLILNLGIFAVIAPLVGKDDYVEKTRAELPGAHGIVLADSHGTRLDEAQLRAAGIANLSTGSDSYADMLNKLRYALSQQRIDLVVVSADGHTLSKYREYTNNLEKSSLLVGEGKFAAVVHRYFPLVDPKGRDLFKASVIAKLGRLFERSRPADKAGAGPAEPSFAWKDKPNRKALAARRAETQFAFGEPSPALRKTLLTIVAECRAAGVRVVGLRFPLAGDYLDEIKGKDYGAAQVLLDAGVPVLDHEELYRGRDELFEDQDHLNPAGGAAFTRLVLEELGAGGQP